MTVGCGWKMRAASDQGFETKLRPLTRSRRPRANELLQHAAIGLDHPPCMLDSRLQAGELLRTGGQAVQEGLEHLGSLLRAALALE